MAPEASPPGCPCAQITADNQSEYRKDENLAFGRAASIVSMSLDGPKPRILEIIEVANRSGFHRLGLAFCAGLAEEAKILSRILTYHGFEVESVVCKVGGFDKSLQDIENGGNAMCNPIGQAQLLNARKTDFNIIMGLCVGHDSLFFKYSDAPVTVFAVKDKVLAHNPMGVLYMADSYYKDVLFPHK